MCAHSMLTESGNVTFYSHSTLELAQRDVRERERAAKTQMVRAKTTPKPRSCKPRSNEVMFLVFLVS
jgi:hypothetical protein